MLTCAVQGSRRLRSVLFATVAALVTTLAGMPPAWGEVPVFSPTVPGRYLVIFRENRPTGAQFARLRRAGVLTVTPHTNLPTAAVTATAQAAQSLASDPAVERVVADRLVYAHRLVSRANLASGEPPSAVRPVAPRRPIVLDPASSATGGNDSASTSSTVTGGSSTNSDSAALAVTDTFYQGSPQGWAVRASGGYGNGVLGGTTTGPWNRTLGAGVRIAVLDSGVDQNHPDIAPNLALNLSEVDSAAQPSACDDGSPEDQQGHGTWVASLAAGAMGSSTGRTVGVAPLATLLNIKVLQRMPGNGNTVAAQCAAGEAAGLASWLLKGIDDAVSQRADVIVLSLGSIVDLYTGDGAGLKSVFDRVTQAAANAGVLIVAAAGNDAFDLSSPRYLQLPAQARGVLAVVASTNPACAENNAAGAACAAGTVGIPYYSNHGAPLQAIAAPGGNYPAGGDESVSGWVRGACSNGKPGTADGPPADGGHSYGCFNLGHTQYVQAMGTSASAGLAGGAAALIRAAHPDWTPSKVIAAMRSSALQLANGSVLLNTAAALDF